MNYIAIEFDDEKLLVGNGALAGKRILVRDLFSLPTQQKNEAQIASDLKSLLAEHRVAKADAIVIVKRTQVEIRELSLPPAPDNDLPDMVKFIARNEFASLNEHWLLDFIPFSDDESEARKVMATGLAPEKQKRILQICEGAGLRVKHIVLRPFAVYSAIKGTLSSEKDSMIVDLGEGQIDMIVCSHRKVVSTRTVRSSSSDSATHLKHLLSEIKRTAMSSQNVVKSGKIEEIVLLGLSEQDKSLAKELAEQLEIQVRSLSLFEIANVDLRDKDVSNANQYSAVLGSLIQQASGDRHPIDYLNPRKPVIRKTGRQKLQLYGGLAAAAAIAAFAFAFMTLRSQSTEIALLNSQLKDLQERNAGTANRPGVEQIIGETKVVDQWKESDVNWLEELTEKSNRFLTSDDAIVDLFDGVYRDNNAQITIKGRNSAGSRTKLIDSLESRPYAVRPLQWESEDQDPSYPEPFNFVLTRAPNPSQLIKDIDEKAAQLQKEQIADRQKNAGKE